VHLGGVSSNDFALLVLRKRATVVSADDGVIVFRVIADGAECALVAVRLETDNDVLELEEIYVCAGKPSSRRRKRSACARGTARAREQSDAHQCMGGTLDAADDDSDAKVKLIE